MRQGVASSWSASSMRALLHPGARGGRRRRREREQHEAARIVDGQRGDALLDLGEGIGGVPAAQERQAEPDLHEAVDGDRSDRRHVVQRPAAEQADEEQRARRLALGERIAIEHLRRHGHGALGVTQRLVAPPGEHQPDDERRPQPRPLEVGGLRVAEHLLRRREELGVATGHAELRQPLHLEHARPGGGEAGVEQLEGAVGVVEDVLHHLGVGDHQVDGRGEVALVAAPRPRGRRPTRPATRASASAAEPL